MNKKAFYRNGKPVKLTSDSLIYKKKKTVKAKQNFYSKVLKTKRPKSISQDYEIGQFVGKLATTLWKQQANPQKIYVDGHRLHHGVVGLALVFRGSIIDSDVAMGLGNVLVQDDIDDASEWFRFEKEQSYNFGYV